jgi:hypothetical protein
MIYGDMVRGEMKYEEMVRGEMVRGNALRGNGSRGNGPRGNSARANDQRGNGLRGNENTRKWSTGKWSYGETYPIQLKKLIHSEKSRVYIRYNRVKISNTFLRQISFSFEVKGENNYNLFHVKRSLIAAEKTKLNFKNLKTPKSV